MHKPKFWKGITILLGLEKAFCIVAMVFLSISFTVTMFTCINAIREYIEIVQAEGSAAAHQNFSLVFKVYSLVTAVSGFVLEVPFSIVSLTLCQIVIRDLPKVTNKKDAVKLGVLALVAGILGQGFAVGAGVLVLITKQRDYPDGQPKKEVVDAEVVEETQAQ